MSHVIINEQKDSWWDYGIIEQAIEITDLDRREHWYEDWEYTLRILFFAKITPYNQSRELYLINNEIYQRVDKTNKLANLLVNGAYAVDVDKQTLQTQELDVKKLSSILVAMDTDMKDKILLHEQELSKLGIYLTKA
jgi:hypothetical protein